MKKQGLSIVTSTVWLMAVPLADIIIIVSQTKNSMVAILEYNEGERADISLKISEI